MNEKVIIAFWRGEKVRLKNWPPGEYFYLNPATHNVFDKNAVRWENPPLISNLLSNDFEIYEEPILDSENNIIKQGDIFIPLNVENPHPNIFHSQVEGKYFIGFFCLGRFCRGDDRSSSSSIRKLANAPQEILDLIKEQK